MVNSMEVANCSNVYFNFDEEEKLNTIFEKNKNPQRIIELLSMICGEKIYPNDTLVIFDEIQECPAALNSLKYFRQMNIISLPQAVYLEPRLHSPNPIRWGW